MFVSEHLPSQPDVRVASDLMRSHAHLPQQEIWLTMKSDIIRSEALQRSIKSLYHFTPLPNLESILVSGLLSRRILDQNQMKYFCTDDWRNDGQPDAVSFSIHEINGSMFSKKLDSSDFSWAILEIDASVLWTHDCRFCWKNASSAEIVDHTGYIGGPWAFRKMFDDRPVNVLNQQSFRKFYRRSQNKPTRNDAEVQVLETVSPQLIRDVTVARESHRETAKLAMASAGLVLPIEIYPDIFA